MLTVMKQKISQLKSPGHRHWTYHVWSFLPVKCTLEHVRGDRCSKVERRWSSADPALMWASSGLSNRIIWENRCSANKGPWTLHRRCLYEEIQYSAESAKALPVERHVLAEFISVSSDGMNWEPSEEQREPDSTTTQTSQCVVTARPSGAERHYWDCLPTASPQKAQPHQPPPHMIDRPKSFLITTSVVVPSASTSKIICNGMVEWSVQLEGLMIIHQSEGEQVI